MGSDPRFPFWGLTPVFAIALALSAEAQTYKPTPIERCYGFGQMRIGRGAGAPSSPLVHALAAQSAEARGLCEQAIRERPKDGTLHATLARVLALEGNRTGALEAARTAAALGEGRGAPEGAAALDWYRRGADAGVMSAQYQLGRMYAKGDVVLRDDALAAEWLTKAAQQGHPAARKEAAELLFALGRDEEAAALGHEGAARRLAARLIAAGQPGAAEELRRYLADTPRRFPPPPVFPSGIARDPGEDPTRAIALRVGGVADMQSAAVNAAIASPYDIIRWFPETDGKR